VRQSNKAKNEQQHWLGMILLITPHAASFHNSICKSFKYCSQVASVLLLKIQFGTKFALDSANFKTQKINTMKQQFHTWFNPKNSFQMKLFLLFKPKLQWFIWVGLCLLLAQAANAQISGTVFFDGNNDGIKQLTERTLANMTVNAVAPSGATLTDITDTNGNYTILGTTAGLSYRVELSVPFGYNDAAFGSNSGTSVQFAASNATALDFGINVPDKCSPDRTIRVVTGMGLTSVDDYTVKSWDYITDRRNVTAMGSAGTTTPHAKDLLDVEVGVPFGVAVQKRTDLLYFSTIAATLTNVFPAAPDGIDALYVAQYNGPGKTFTGYKFLTKLSSYGISVAALNPVDNETGEYGLGGVTISEDGNYLYVVNMGKGNIAKIDISGVTFGSIPVGGYTNLPVTEIGLTSTNCPNGIFRPSAIEYYAGRLYVVGICDASVSGSASSDLRLRGFEMNVATNTFSEVLDYDLSTFTGGGLRAVGWPQKKWSGTWLGTDSDGSVGEIQPIVPSLGFDDNGAMIIGITNRQVFVNGSSHRETGYMLRTWKETNGSFTVEFGGVSGPYTSTAKGSSTNSGAQPGYYDGSDDPSTAGPGNDWFFEVGRTTSHPYLYNGGILVVPGTNLVIGGFGDPGNPATQTGGRYLDYTTGISLYGTSLVGQKASVMGDLEAICGTPPIEIGNRVWFDTDSDGVQDGDESGISGVTVELYQGTTFLASAITNVDGHYIFSSDTKTSTASFIYGVTGLAQLTNYSVRIPNIQGAGKQGALGANVLTVANTSGTLNDETDKIDSDGLLQGNNAEVAFTTRAFGSNSHTLDFGFRAQPPCTLTVSTAVPTACVPATNTYNLAVTVSYSNPPTGDITINVGGTNYTFTPDGTSPDTYNVPGLTSNGTAGIDVSATFVGDAACTHTLADAYDAPASCLCNLSASADGTNVLCNGGTDGTATATASGNIAAVTYAWSNGGTTATISNLAAGTYSVTISESASCTAVASYTVTEPAILDITCDKTDVTTNGGADGTATVNATGGTSPYTYLWNSGETTASISSKTSATYTVTVTDANGCTALCNSTINEPGCNLSAAADGTNVLCNGGTDGTATATASGNIAAVTYAWSNGGTTATISNLAAGTYSVTISESASCTAVASYTVTEPAILDITCDKTDVTTNGGADGTATVNATGGTSPYTYLWNSGETTATISGKTSGTYTVTVTDANGCTALCNSTINEPGCNLSAAADGTNVLCNGGTDGTATATASGNIAAVTYAWSNGGTTATISNLAAGTYSVTISESASCTAVASYTVTEPAILDITCDKTDVTTNGGSDGTATVSATGGTSPYTYLWNSGETTATISGKTSGTYTVTVTDANGCTALCNSTINEPGCNLSAAADGTNVLCNGGTDGTATATASGNIAAVTYAWSNGGTTATISNLAAGTYSVTISESASCTAVASYTVTEPAILDITCDKTDVTTIGGTDGTATVSATGGTSPYTYLWNSGETTASISGKTSGTYTVTVTDANGCTALCNSTINEPGCNLSATADGTNVLCNGGTDGTATATASGNTAAVTYAWSNGGTTATINNLAAGTYTVTISESASCTAVASYTVTEPPIMDITCDKTDVTTNGGSDGTASVVATGGISPYAYLWNTSETTASISNKTSGTYTVTVTDANGCTDVCASSINEPGAVPDLSLAKTVSNAIAPLNSQMTFTLTLSNDNGITATGVVVTDQLPAGVTFVSTSDPANVSVSGGTITWNVGTFLGTDAPKTLDITVTASNEGVFINNAEITAMTETDDDSTPNNDVAGEDDQDQACFSIPVTLCSDNADASITVTANTATTYQWYVSTDNGASYTALSGETNQTLTINNTLMGGNGITKYFKVAYNGAGINDGCGDVMCCPIIVTTQTCVVCPAPKCIPIAVSKVNP
jgi:uncharacterized repeat protein (TIGR01451 family)